MKTNKRVRGARSSWRLYAAFALAAALGGCVTTQSGSPLSSLATVGGLPKGMARIVVVRQEPRSLGARNGNFPVKLDGQPLGELSPGTFVSLDCPAGSHQLSADLSGWPGVTRHDFTAAPGRTYYFRASLNEKANGISVATVISPIGGLIAAAATYNDRQGPIDLTPIGESEAKQAMVSASFQPQPNAETAPTTQGAQQ
jgi:hypothetical protein